MTRILFSPTPILDRPRSMCNIRPTLHKESRPRPRFNSNLMHSYDAMLKSYICDCMAKKHAEMFTIYKNWFKSSALMFSRIESLIYTRNKLLMLER